MFKVVIIEDEPLARSKLKRLLQDLPDEITVIAELSSVTETDHWLSSGGDADLIFSDIELTDGNVFQCYQRHTPPCPLIFITAYDAFMLQAFDSHGIAYLLKPYSSDKLRQAWLKFRHLTGNGQLPELGSLHQLQTLLSNLAASQATYTSRIPIRQQQQIYFLDVNEIAYIQADGSLIMAFDNSGKRHYLPYNSLQAAEAALDPTRFFRLNRSEIVQSQSIERLERYCKNTLAVYLRSGIQLKTSQSRTSEFNRWLGL